MSLQRCYTLSVSRPIRKFTTYSIIRFISNNIVINNCSAKVIDNNLNTVKIEQSDIPSECEKLKNGGYVSQIQSNLNANVNTVSSVHIQQINSNLPSDDYLEDSDITLPHPLDTCTEDVSDIGPPLTPTFTFAKYANKSNTIQELVKLGVHLYKFESQEGMLQYILSLDFERDVKPYIRFLHDCGVPADYLGTFITKHPNIFKENMDDLYTRIRYLRAHEFNTNMISTIICKNPMWLSYKTTDIDGRLAYFQSNFKLKGHEVRMLTVKGPKVVTYRMTHLFANTYTIKEEMGFDQWQMKALLLRMPRIWTKSENIHLNNYINLIMNFD